MPKKIKNAYDEVQDTIDVDRIHTEIIRQYKSVYAFAHHFGLDQATISRILKRKMPVTLKVLAQYCELLDLELKVQIVKNRAA